MRCRAGDIAFIIHDRYGDEGRLVTVVRALLPFEAEHMPPEKARGGFIWFIRCVAGRDLNTSYGAVPCAYIYDHWLRPLPRRGDAASAHDERRKEFEASLERPRLRRA